MKTENLIADAGDYREPAWIGAHINKLQASALLFMGVVGIAAVNLLPLTLGALESEHRLSTAELGQAATAEMAAVGIMCMIMALFKPVGLRYWASGASILLIIINLMTTHMSSSVGIIAMRGAAGVPEGILVWLPMSMIARSNFPVRWSGIYLTVITVASFIIATILPDTLMGTYGANGGFYALALLAVGGVLATLAIPSSFTPLSDQDVGQTKPGRLPISGLAALASAFFFQVCAGAVWTYLAPLSTAAGHPASTLALAVSVGLAAQVCGGLLASFLDSKVPFFPVLVVGFAALVLSLIIIHGLPGPGVFIVAIFCFTFLSQFLQPFEWSLTISADQTRRSAVLMAPAMMIGGSSGPLIASIVIGDAGSGQDATVVAVVGTFISLGLAFYAYYQGKRVHKKQQISVA